jgi:hypothetical protein
MIWKVTSKIPYCYRITGVVQKKNPTVRIYEAYLLIISSASERDCLDALSLSFRSFTEFCNSVFDVLKESSCFCFSSSAN